MRHVDIDLPGLEQALKDSAGAHGTDLTLDLRANAYGFGVEVVSGLAKDLGFRLARVCPRHLDRTVLLTSQATPSTDWLERAHQYGAQKFWGTVVNLKRVPEGTGVSYGGRYVTQTDTRLALVTLGFADGLPRLDPVGGEVELAGRVVSVAGRIAMDQCILDIGELEVGLGERAVAWGGLVPIAQWAKWSGRCVPALGAGIAARVQRHLRGVDA